MTKKELAYILEKRKWPGYWQYPSHKGGRYVTLILGIPFFVYMALLVEKDILITHEWDGDYLSTAIVASVIGALLIALFIQNIKAQNKFTELTTIKSYTAKEILNIVHKLNWMGNSSNTNNSVEVLTPRISFFLIRQRITIIVLNESQLLFNSYSLSEMIIINRNRDNLKKFLALIDTQ